MTITQDLKAPNLPKYIELFVLDMTPLGGSVLRFTPSTVAGQNALVFGGNTYTPLPITGSGWETSIDGAAPQPLLKVSNVTKYIQTYLTSNADLVGARLTRYQTFDKYLDAASIPRRNLLNYSDQFNSWSGSLPVTADVDGGPFGDGRADLVTASASGQQRSQTSASFAAGSTITVSCYAKKSASTNFFRFEVGNLSDAWFDLSAGAVSFANAGSGSFVTAGSGVSDIGNGWYRCWLTVSTTTVTTASVSLMATTASASTNVAGDQCYVYGAQCEVGSAPTAYQFTTTTHQPYADSSQVFNTCVYSIEQKTKQSKYEIEFRLASIIDTPQIKLPRQQVLRAEFPGAGLFRKN